MAVAQVTPETIEHGSSIASPLKAVAVLVGVPRRSTESIRLDGFRSSTIERVSSRFNRGVALLRI
ncbi:hypothetical protein BRC77_13950 [Halobacteriales archaeon QH_8_64_26]|nr:MAG: hypothetical protein BRC77_13950 [Halobacteriales archaeon QH_8_64_26]